MLNYEFYLNYKIKKIINGKMVFTKVVSNIFWTIFLNNFNSVYSKAF